VTGEARLAALAAVRSARNSDDSNLNRLIDAGDARDLAVALAELGAEWLGMLAGMLVFDFEDFDVPGLVLDREVLAERLLTAWQAKEAKET